VQQDIDCDRPGVSPKGTSIMYRDPRQRFQFAAPIGERPRDICDRVRCSRDRSRSRSRDHRDG
jgi:hypothetical protein